MKKNLQNIFNSTEERLKNPLIAPFITFWILFNWKPILCAIHSSTNIVDKIRLIDENFILISHLLFYPLITALFYVLVSPYLSLVVDMLLNHSLLKRNEIVVSRQKQNIENQKQFAIEEIKLEEAKIAYRERNSTNQIIEDLEKNFAEIETNLLAEREKNSQNLMEINKEVMQIQNNHQKDINQYKNQISNLTNEISEMRERIFKADREINYPKDENSIKRMRINEKEEIIILRNGKEFLRRNDGNKNIFIDKMDGLVYSETEFAKRFIN